MDGVTTNINTYIWDVQFKIYEIYKDFEWIIGTFLTHFRMLYMFLVGGGLILIFTHSDL